MCGECGECGEVKGSTKSLHTCNGSEEQGNNETERCAICLEYMLAGQDIETTVCCGQNLHKKCFLEFCKKAPSVSYKQLNKVACLFCRQHTPRPITAGCIFHTIARNVRQYWKVIGLLILLLFGIFLIIDGLKYNGRHVISILNYFGINISED